MFPNFPNLTTPAQNQLVAVAVPRSQTEENAIIAGGRAAPGIVQRRRIPGDGGTAGQAWPYPWQNPEPPPAGQRAAMMKNGLGHRSPATGIRPPFSALRRPSSVVTLI